MAEYVVAQAAVLIVPTLGKGPNSFQVQLEKELKKVQKSFDVEMRADTKKLVAQGLAAKKALEQDPVNVRFRIVDATKQITEIRQKYEDIAREVKKGLFLNLKIVGMSVLPQLAAGLAAVNASMVDLTKSALLLPGILAGVASSVATIATGLGGVKAAFREYGDAQKNAAQEGLKARNAAKNVQNAYRDLGRSIKDAKRNLEDLNAELRGAPLDEADAIIAVAEARQEAADRAGKSGLQQQKDTLALMRAENALVDVRLRNSRLIQDAAEANAKGVAGSDAVTEATERLSKATDEANTQTTKLSDSLKELSPNAQSFVKAITGMTDEWAAFKNATQDRLFAGLDQEITQLAQVSLPTLQKGFGAIADSLNGNVKAAFKAIESETNQGFLDKIFGDTASAQANLSKAFDPFIDSLLRLSAAGTDFLPRLVDGLVDLTTRFDNFIVRAEADGSLDKWINQGIDEFKALGNSIINVGSMLNSLSEAFTGSGGQTFLQVLEDGSKKLADFMDSAEGQEKLKRFFTDAREEFRKWGPLLDQLPGLMSNLAQAGQQWANLLLPFLTSAGTLLAQHPGLVKLIFGAYVGWKTIVPVVKSLKNGIELLSKATGLLNEVLFSGATGHIGKFAAATDNMKSKVGSLTSAIAGPAGLTAMATALGTYLAYSLVDAHDEASAAAQRQKKDLDDLTQSLTDVTGAATAATNALVARNFREGQNAATGKSYGDLLNTVLPDAGQQTDLTQRVGAGDLAGALAMVPGAADAAAIEKTDLWKYYAQNLKDAGLNSDLVARAVNGDPAAKEKFDKWIVEERRRKASNVLPFSGSMSPEVLSGLETGNVISSTPDLLDIQEMLPQDMRDRSRVQNEIYANTTQIQQGTANTRLDNERGQGSFKLPAGSPFAPLGVLVEPGVGSNREGELLTSSAPPEGSALAEQFRNDGVTFRQDGPGRYIVSLTPEAAAKYFVPRYASGGMVSGPGSGTSDSIMARLSHGEYVINAASTKKHLPLLEQINGGQLQGFAPGGLVLPKSPSPVPPSPIDIAPMSQPTISVGGGAGATMSGSAKGSPDGSPVDQRSTAGKFFGGVGNFFKAAMGIGDPPPGYSETTAATLSTKDSAWANLTAPVAPKPPAVEPPDFTSYPDYLNQVRGDILKAGGAETPQAPTVTPPTPTKTSGTVATSTDSRVNPSTPVHSGSKPSAGPGNKVPHQVAGSPGSPARPGPYPISASSGFVPGGAILPQGIAAGSEAGLRDLTIRGRRALLAAFPFLEEVGGYREDSLKWHPNGQALDAMIPASLRFTQQGYALGDSITQWALQNASGLGVEHVIWNKKIYYPDGRSENMRVTGDRTQDHEDHPHIVFSESPYPTADSQYFAPPSGIAPFSLDGQGLAGSPSNMPMAGTPTGVQLPQLTYAPGMTGGGTGPQSNSVMIPGFGSFKMPTPEEYVKGLTDSWMKTLDNLVKNAGQIALNFLGSFFGLDLSGLLGTANSFLGGGDENGEGGKDSGLPALPEVDAILKSVEFNQLPPEYQQQLAALMEANPQNSLAYLEQFIASAAAGLNATSAAGAALAAVPAFAAGGKIKGAGSGKSDSMIARVSNGEYVVKAAQARKHMGLLDAINSGSKLPGFADGGPIINPMFPPPPPPPVPPVTTPPPPPSPVPPTPGGPSADAAAGMPGAAPTPVTENAGPGDAESAALKDVGAAIGGIGDVVSGVADGASAPAGGNPEGDPRAVMGAAPQNLDHNKPAVSAGIQAAGSAISGAISTAMSVGSAGASLAAPGAGAGLGSASGIISGLIGAGAGAVSGAVNVLSSLGVGTVTPSTSTAGAYGAPLTPQAMGQDSYKGPSVVNNWNGGVHTQNNEEFYKLQQRRELQNAAPYLPQR